MAGEPGSESQISLSSCKMEGDEGFGSGLDGSWSASYFASKASALHVLAPLSHAGVDLKSSSADIVVFLEPHVPRCPVRQFCLYYPYDVGLVWFICPCMSGRSNTAQTLVLLQPLQHGTLLCSNQNSPFVAWPIAGRGPRAKDSKNFDCCNYAGAAVSWENG